MNEEGLTDLELAAKINISVKELWKIWDIYKNKDFSINLGNIHATKLGDNNWTIIEKEQEK